MSTLERMAPTFHEHQSNHVHCNDRRQNSRCFSCFTCETLSGRKILPVEHARHTYDKNCGTSLTRSVATHVKSNVRKQLHHLVLRYVPCSCRVRSPDA